MVSAIPDYLIAGWWRFLVAISNISGCDSELQRLFCLRFQRFPASVSAISSNGFRISGCNCIAFVQLFLVAISNLSGCHF
jgi:hypothetical protein